MTLISMIIKFLLCCIVFSFIVPFWAKKLKNDVNPLALFGVLCIISCLVMYFPYGLDKKSNTPQEAVIDYPAFTSPVVDEDGLLTANQKQEVLNYIQELKDYQLAVAILKDTRGVPMEQYAVDLFNNWGIGSKEKNNGVLFVIAPSMRQVRIPTGYGAEGLLTDIKSGIILDNYVIPYFKQENIPQGIISGTNAIVRTLNGEKLIAEKSSDINQNNNWEKGYVVPKEYKLLVSIILLIPCILGVIGFLVSFPRINACIAFLGLFLIGVGLLLMFIFEWESIGVKILFLGLLCTGWGKGGRGSGGFGGGRSGGGGFGGGGRSGGGGAGRSW